MQKPDVRVTTKMRGSSRLPQWAAEGGFLLLMLGDIVEEATRRWRDNRRAGARGGGVVFAFLVLYFAQRTTRSLKKVSDRCAAHRRQFAGLVGRKNWIAQSALSTALSKMSAEDAESFCSWLLVEATPTAKWQGSALAAMRDTRGTPWHVFDFDPTVKAFRQRALPSGDDLSEPKRRAAHLAAAGHTGRKRGTAVCARAVLQHAGTGVWLGNWPYRGNADGYEALSKSAQPVARWCERLGVDSRQAIVRFDGGVNSGIRACREVGLHFVTRSAKYGALDAPEIRAHLRVAEWSYVPDSRSGPRRSAAELGFLELAGRRVRVVVTRCEDGGRGAGTVIGAERYELFATSLDADCWPAPELVALYYGRSAQENHFAREDIELKLDRPLSYQLPGFQIATSVGLFVWNLRTFLGARLCAVDERHLPAQQQREPERVEPPELPVVPAPSVSEPAEPMTLQQRVKAHLGSMNWPLVMRQRGLGEDWGWNEVTETLECPNGKSLRLRQSLKQTAGTLNIRLRASKAACRDCPLRSGCTSSAKPEFRKEVAVPLKLRQKARRPLRLHATWSPPEPASPGPYTVLGHHVRLATLRNAASEELGAVSIHVDSPREPQPAKLVWLASTPAERQRRRKSDHERRLYNALLTAVNVSVEASKAAEELLERRG